MRKERSNERRDACPPLPFGRCAWFIYPRLGKQHSPIIPEPRYLCRIARIRLSVFADPVPSRSTELDRSFDILEHTARFIHRETVLLCSSVHELLIRMAIVADWPLDFHHWSSDPRNYTFTKSFHARNQLRRKSQIKTHVKIIMMEVVNFCEIWIYKVQIFLNIFPHIKMFFLLKTSLSYNRFHKLFIQFIHRHTVICINHILINCNFKNISSNTFPSNLFFTQRCINCRRISNRKNNISK